MERRTALGLVAVLLPPLLYSFYRFSIGALVPAFEATYSVNDATAGEVVSASVGLVAIGVFGGGLLAQRLGDARTILLGLVIFSASEAAVVAAGSLWEFSAFFFVASFGTGLVITPSYGVDRLPPPGPEGPRREPHQRRLQLGGLRRPVARGVPAGLPRLGRALRRARPHRRCLHGRLRRPSSGGPGRVGPAQPSISYAKVLAIRAVLVLAVADFFADLGFLVFVSWTPKYLISAFSVTGGGRPPSTPSSGSGWASAGSAPSPRGCSSTGSAGGRACC